MYLTDSNINHPKDDKLNRDKFSKSLAQSVASYVENDCLTIALMGKWGSGKTSIIKMFEFYLREINSNYEVIYFNPWHFSNRNNLLFQFFDVLSKEIDKKFTKIINKDNLADFGKFLINSFSVSFPFSGAGITFNPKIETVTNENETLLDLKEKIIQDFSKIKNKKIVIVIDDIDRLTNIEIQQIFMLVKSLADFPNVIYLLSFDESAVVGSLNKIGVYSPKTFIEKIVQIPIKVPEISQYQLERLVDEYLFDFYKINHPRDKINISHNDIFSADEFIAKEFLNIRSLLNPFFKTPRDLYRYVNILKFYFSTFKHQVNINDFMLIVAIQLFHEEMYNFIKHNKDLFLVNYNDQEKLNLRDTNKQEIECTINLVGNNSIHIKKVLKALFPQLEYYYHNMEYSIEYLRKWRYFLRVCTVEFFDGYFTLTLGDDEIGILEINDFFRYSDVESISEFMFRQNNENRTRQLFDLMINRINDISKDNAKYFITSLMDIGDLLKIESKWFLDDKKTYLSRILHDLLKKYDDNKERYTILKEAISNSKKSLFVSVSILSHEDFVYNRFDYKNDRLSIDEALIDEEDLKELEDIVVEKIRIWDDAGILWESMYLRDIIYSWKNWDNEDYVNDRLIKNDFK